MEGILVLALFMLVLISMPFSYALSTNAWRVICLDYPRYNKTEPMVAAIVLSPIVLVLSMFGMVQWYLYKKQESLRLSNSLAVVGWVFVGLIWTLDKIKNSSII